MTPRETYRFTGYIKIPFEVIWMADSLEQAREQVKSDGLHVYNDSQEVIIEEEKKDE